MMMTLRSRWLGLVVLCFCQAASAAEVITVAGTGKKGNSPTGTPARSAQIGEPYGVVIGPDGALYICEIASHLIRRVDLQTGGTQIVVGTGERGNSGDNGPATATQVDEPYEVRFDSQGNLVFVDMKNANIRRVDAKTGVISTIAGNGTPGFSGDGGPAPQAQLREPHSLALDRDDNIYICDIKNARVRRVDAHTGIITTLIGGGRQPLPLGTAAFDDLALKGPRALDTAGPGEFILAIREGNAIYRVDLQQRILTHLAGTGKSGYSPQSLPGAESPLSGPKGVALAPDGDIYFADTESHTIRVIRKENGHVETVVGDGTRGDGPDGDPLHCRLARPHSVCVDSAGNVYIGDSENHRVRMLKP